MLPKYKIEYGIPVRNQITEHHYETDDPVAAEQFLAQLLESRFRILNIKHDGTPLSKHDFNNMVKTAAGMVAAQHICDSLAIKPEEERFTFGFAA